MLKSSLSFKSRCSCVSSATPKSANVRSSQRRRFSEVLSYPWETGYHFIITIIIIIIILISIHFLALLNSDMQLLHAGSLLKMLPSHFSCHRSAGAFCDVLLCWQHLQLGWHTSKKSDRHHRILPCFWPLLKNNYDIHGLCCFCNCILTLYFLPSNFALGWCGHVVSCMLFIG